VTGAGRGPGRVLALDPGTARIGVAVSDSERLLAFPRPPVGAGADEVTRCVALVLEEGAMLVVVGHPLRLDGTEGPAAAHAVALASSLRAALGPHGVEVVLHDERLTTVTATSRLRAAGVGGRDARVRVDGAAAVVLLESWMSA
jgi:putative Holliday junction resolvase